jgi:hypothetical protein
MIQLAGLAPKPSVAKSHLSAVQFVAYEWKGVHQLNII